MESTTATATIVAELDLEIFDPVTRHRSVVPVVRIRKGCRVVAAHLMNGAEAHADDAEWLFAHAPTTPKAGLR